MRYTMERRAFTNTKQFSLNVMVHWWDEPLRICMYNLHNSANLINIYGNTNLYGVRGCRLDIGLYGGTSEWLMWASVREASLGGGRRGDRQ